MSCHSGQDSLQSPDLSHRHSNEWFVQGRAAYEGAGTDPDWLEDYAAHAQRAGGGECAFGFIWQISPSDCETAASARGVFESCEQSIREGEYVDLHTQRSKLCLPHGPLWIFLETIQLLRLFSFLFMSHFTSGTSKLRGVDFRRGWGVCDVSLIQHLN